MKVTVLGRWSCRYTESIKAIAAPKYNGNVVRTNQQISVDTIDIPSEWPTSVTAFAPLLDRAVFTAARIVAAVLLIGSQRIAITKS